MALLFFFPTASRAPAHALFIIHTSCQDNSLRHVLTEVEGTKRLAGPLSLCQPNKVQQLYCRPVRSQQWPHCPEFLLHPRAPPVLVFPSLAYIQRKLLWLSTLGSRKGWVRSYYLKSRPSKFLWSVGYEVVLISLPCSMHKAPFWIIFTGQSGTTMSP